MSLTQVKGSVLPDAQTIPSQSGQAGKFLSTNSTTPVWDDALKPENNLSDVSNKGTARSNLDTYSKSEADERYLNESSNLSDLTNVATARNNISTYSKSQTDGLISTLTSKVNTNTDDITGLDAELGYALIDAGTVVINTRYVRTNPFGNSTPVVVQAEIYLNGRWSNSGWLFAGTGQGTLGTYVEGEGIVIQTGNGFVHNQSLYMGSGHGNTTVGSSALCRVHVWRVKA